ncbi:MAG: SDR family NAD(P)-dependent oxidoreductase [Bacteroidota bacterium]
MKRVAITGAGKGLGAQAAIVFANKGYQVFGTALNEAELNKLQAQMDSPNLYYFICDVTKRGQVDKGAAFIKQTVNGAGIDILVNKACNFTPGPIEIFPTEEIAYDFEVNILGSLRATNAFVPMLRQAKGCLLQIGSLSGVLAVLYNSTSHATKAMMEAFSDVFRTELRSFEVDFTIVAPSNILTTMPAKTISRVDKLIADMTPEQEGLYRKGIKRFSEGFKRMQIDGMPVEGTARRLIEIT